MIDLSVQIDEINLRLDREIERGIRDLTEEEAIDLADFLQRNSPTGVSPVSQSLRGSWDVSPGQGEVIVIIENTAPYAFQRIVGVPPGTFPPWSEGSELNDWVRGKLGIRDLRERAGVSFAIARQIDDIGTERYRTGDNILGVDPETGNFRRDSPVREMGRRLEGRLNAELNILA